MTRLYSQKLEVLELEICQREKGLANFRRTEILGSVRELLDTAGGRNQERTMDPEAELMEGN